MGKFGAVICLLFIGLTNGHPLSNTLQDNGHAHGHCEFDVLILLDCSGSITENGGAGNWQEVLRFTRMLVEGIDAVSAVGTSTRVGVIAYSSNVELAVGLDQQLGIDQLVSEVDNVVYQRGLTRMYAAVQLARDHFATNARQTEHGGPVSQFLILFTDGKPYSMDASHAETTGNVMEVLEGLMDTRVHVMMIGINEADRKLMETINDYVNIFGREDYGRARMADSFSQLGSVDFAPEILQPVQQSCQESQDCKVDVLILVDASGSIGNEIFKDEVKPFVEELVNAIHELSPIGPYGTRVGVTAFSMIYKVMRSITEGTSSVAIREAIATMTHHNSWTHMVDALEKARDELSANQRPGVGLRLILITDGVPEHYEDAENENIPRMISTLENYATDDGTPIRTSVIGFRGKKFSEELPQVLDQLRNSSISDVEEGLTKETARSIVDRFGIDCPAMELLQMCNIDLAIVLDDTSEEAFAESRDIADTLVTEQLMPYIDADIVRMRIVTATQTLLVSQMNVLQWSPSNDTNLLLRALYNTQEAFALGETNGRHKVALLIHSGVLNFDAPEEPLDSFHNLAFKQLKHRFSADVISLPLERLMDAHGREVLQRLHSLPGAMLTQDANIPFLLPTICPRYDACESMDIVFVLDVSASVDIDSMKFHADAALMYFKHNFTEQARIAIVTFSEYPCVLNDLETGQIFDDETFERMKRNINSLRPSVLPMTNLATTLDFVTKRIFGNHGDRMPGTNHILVFSDAGVNVQTMGVDSGNAVAMDNALQDGRTMLMVKPPILIESPGIERTFVDAPSIQTIDSFRTAFGNELLQARQCDVKALDPPAPCRDLVIVMDSSGSLEDQGRQGYKPVQDFVMGVIDRYYSSGRGQRLGVIHYSEIAETIVDFANHATTFMYAINDVNRTAHLGGLTNVEAAFEATRNMTEGLDPNSYAIAFLSDGEANRGRDGTEVLSEMQQDMDEGTNVLLGVFITNTFEDSQNSMRSVLSDERQLYVEFFPDLPSATNMNWIVDHVC